MIMYSESSPTQNRRSRARTPYARIREFNALRRIGHIRIMVNVHGHMVNSVVEVTVEQPLRVHRPALVGELRAV